MSAGDEHGSSSLSIRIDREKCNGCVVCMRACPTRAIRVRRGEVSIEAQRCVDCGECIRVCPKEAIVPLVSLYTEMGRFELTALVPSSMIYTQFGDQVLPNDILLALSKLGFDRVYDPGIFCEMVNQAVTRWLEDNPEVRPALSPTCPVVIRLIASRFPNLIRHLVPVTPPREAAAKYIRRVLSRRHGLDPEKIGVFHITPCAAKRGAAASSEIGQTSLLSGVLGVSDIYRDVLAALKEVTEEDQDVMLVRSSGLGIGWDMSGGEVAGLHQVRGTLCVSGVAETIQVLEHIEAGRLKDVAYVECRTCPDGCLGGPLAVENRYRARATLTILVQMFGTLSRIRPQDVVRLIEEGFFEPEAKITPVTFPLDKDPIKAISKLKKVDELTGKLPGRLCGACGAPDCRTFAEDVVQGKAELSDCPFIDPAALEEEA